MSVDFAISLMRLRPTGGHAAAKLRQETRLFDLISIKLKDLHAILANSSGGQEACDSVAANQGQNGGVIIGDLKRMRPHLDFCAAARWQVTVPGVSGCHEIAENIPQRSRLPVTFRWSCA
jgi:hypothetical protein